MPSLPVKRTTAQAAVQKVKPDQTLARITQFASTLPPSAPANSDLNPLAQLVSLFTALPLSFSTSTKAAQLELNRQAVHTALHTLKAIFETLIAQGRIHGVLKGAKKAKLGEEDKQDQAGLAAVKEWIKTRWNEYLVGVANIAGAHWDAGVRISALAAFLSLQRTESQFLTSLHPTRKSQFASSTFAILVRALLLPPGDGALLVETKEEFKKWWDRYDDIRFHFLKEATTVVAAYSPSLSSAAGTKALPVPPHLVGNLLSMLELLNTMPTAASELNEWWCAAPTMSKAAAALSKKRKGAPSTKIDDGSTGVFDSSSEEEEEVATKFSSKDAKKLLPPLLSLPAHRRAFQDCWLALLSLPLDEGEAKRVLVILHRQVLPHMTDAKRLMDWLVDCTNSGGTIGILALNGLFTLMQKHNLEYPDFFTKLYSLLDRDVLHVRYRPRFFRLLELFMGSSHLPSALVASFVKRLARLSLSAPPAGVVTVIPFAYNMLKLHPGCMTMIHRPTESMDIESDPFDPLEKDPIKTNASLSSLWELAALRSHYLASVSGLAKIFGEVMSKQSYSMEDFLDHSYGTMFETEATRIIRNAPALAPVPERQPIGDSFFPSARQVVAEMEEDEALAPVDLVSALWVF